jgi:serine/threonine-protein kinase
MTHTTASLETLRHALAERYRVERELGRGGMATVYLARDVKHDREVAIKLLDPELGAVLGAERFLSEIRVTANLQHPNLLPLFDSGSADGLLYYVMPFVDGESLRARLDRERQLPVDEAVRIAVAIAGALDYAHGHGVIHRDLKPENILLQHGQPIVADFGIALAVSNAGGQRVTQTGLSLGTPQYMSPEQATGDRALDARTDIYSLGAVLYEMLAGEAPHTGTSAQAIIAKLMTETPRPLAVLRRTVPEHVDDAVHRALEKLPADRFATARELADALSGRTAIGAATRATRLAHRPWRSRLGDPFVVGVAVLAAAAVIVAAIASRRPPPATPRTVRFAYAGSDSTHPVDNTPWPAAISPDGETVVYSVAAGSQVQLYALRTDQTEARRLPGTAGAFSPVFSPDGQWVAFETGAGKLLEVRIDGSAAPIAVGSANGANGLDWSPRGELLVGAEGAIRGISRIAASGGERVAVTAPDRAKGEEDHLWPVAFHDGALVVFTIWSRSPDRARLAVASVDDGRVTPLGLAGIRPLAVVHDILVYVEASGAVEGIRLDRSGRRTVGAATPVLDPVAMEWGGNGNSGVYISSHGALVTSRNAQVSRLSWIGRDGAVTPILPAPRSFRAPSLSPDGSRIALAIRDGTRSDVWIHDIATATLTRLTTVEAATGPRGTPDGKHVVFIGLTPGGVRAAWIQPADGATPARELAELVPGALGIAPTPDGRALLYTGYVTSWDIFRVALDSGGASSPFVASPANEKNVALSPDGRWLAFESDETGDPEVYALSYPGRDARVQLSAGGGENAVWSADGTRVYYRAGSALVEARLATTPTLRVLSRDTVLRNVSLVSRVDGTVFDVARDGSRLVGLATDATAFQLVIVPTWAAELEQHMAAATHAAR